MQPMKLTQAALAEAMGVQRKHVNELCNNPPERDRGDRTHRRVRVRRQPGLLAQRAAAERSVGGYEQPPRTRADRTSEAAGRQRDLGDGAPGIMSARRPSGQNHTFGAR